MTLIKPKDYRNLLGSVEQTEKAIKHLKDMFQENLSAQLALLRVTAPMVVLQGTGINDDLNSVERAVSFPIRDMDDRRAEVVHSLAKWKRLKLAELGTGPGRGIYTDMNALRPDEELDNIHSIYVDQWDWEKVIVPEERNIAFLKRTVRRIYESIKVTENKLYVEFPQLRPQLPEEIFFIHSQQLLDMYPGLSPKERENEIVREHKAVFVIGIGHALSDGTPHDGRAADYDDWSTPDDEGYYGLNGDILLWNPVLESAFEVSSMGIRVDAPALERQLALRGEEWKKDLYFHRRLLAGELPCTIGGGIGQSRLCMFLLRKAHIGEIQSSIWPERMRSECLEAGIELV
ncbi:aspartate--ammonia ligase [Gallalistipes aquisgranensis]|uniref:aspartate--ammonia ligase n=1 Tax=Gallalistipes aquisgranensis TaxID=2779358 RepID=UPI001CF8E106|nr:aspartate--ammonia ligase [Gallalistipes aquisgranensis]MBE5034391.1 aspartate--ammonia ligase [Gallalistipes aquisgranensis]